MYLNVNFHEKNILKTSHFQDVILTDYTFCDTVREKAQKLGTFAVYANIYFRQTIA